MPRTVTRADRIAPKADLAKDIVREVEAIELSIGTLSAY